MSLLEIVRNEFVEIEVKDRVLPILFRMTERIYVEPFGGMGELIRITGNIEQFIYKRGEWICRRQR